MRETELKFAVHPSFVVPPVEGTSGIVTSERLDPQDLLAIYYDAPDLRLARSGVTLRYRTGDDGGPVWTLKLPTSEGPATRDELSFDAPPDAVPAEALDLVTAFLRSESLVPVAALHTTRIRWRLKGEGGEPLATLADDEVSLLEGEDVRARFREIEIESEGLSLKKLVAIGEVLRAAGAMPSEPIPKAVRALGPRATAPPDVVALPHPGPKDPAADAVKAALSHGLARLITNDPSARLGDLEGVHQTRVAARRLRSDLRTLGPVIDPEWAAEITADLRWLGDALGDVRDLDVLQVRLSSSAQGLGEDLKPLFHTLAARESDARNRLAEALQSARYKSLLDRLVDACLNPPLTELASEPCAKVLPSLVAPVWKDLAKQAKGLSGDASAESYHRVRIRAKRARYAAEAVAPSLGEDAKAARRFAGAAANVQDVLGTLQDANVAIDVIRDVTAEHRGNSDFILAAGRLAERQNRIAERARSQWDAAWAELGRKKNTLWLNG